MARAIDVGTNILVSFVSGTGGTALHFLGFQSLTGSTMGVPNRSLVDVVLGVVSVSAATLWEDGPDWVKTILVILGGTLMGLGIAEWAKWTPQPAIVRGAPRPAAAPSRITVPTAPTIF